MGIHCLGIVGSEAAKFTPAGERAAKEIIRQIINNYSPRAISSGHCHLGGIDIWAEDAANEFGLDAEIFPPKSRSWTHYKARNIQIAETSDVTVCISVGSFPPGYDGMRFPVCYHCVGRKEPHHIKSGGCWTTKYARSIGKEGFLWVVQN